MRLGIGLLVFWLLATGIAAQDDACPALQDAALANIADRCAEQQTENLCLGNPTVSAIRRDSAVETGRFRYPGDEIPLADIDWLSISTEDNAWGTTRALFSAYPGDGLKARIAALLAIGNVAIFLSPPLEQPSPLIDIKVTETRGANLRALPDTESPVIKPVALSSELKAIGRSADGGWLRVYVSPDQLGWISRAVVTKDIGPVPEHESAAHVTPLWLPWQSFDFRSGIDDALCEGSPESGILLQTPEFISPRYFRINGVKVVLSGTVWLQAQVNSGMTIQVTDGVAWVSSRDQTVEVKSGGQTSVALELSEDGNIKAAAAPTESTAYNYHELVSLPIHLLFYPTKIGLDVYTVVAPVADDGGSPLEALSAEDACKISPGHPGANIRSRPDPEAPIIAVMAYRESAQPIARGIGADSLPWWKLADSIWLRVDTTFTGGNCNDIPLILPDS